MFSRVVCLCSGDNIGIKSVMRCCLSISCVSVNAEGASVVAGLSVGPGGETEDHVVAGTRAGDCVFMDTSRNGINVLSFSAHRCDCMGSNTQKDLKPFGDSIKRYKTLRFSVREGYLARITLQQHLISAVVPCRGKCMVWIQLVLCILYMRSIQKR